MPVSSEKVPYYDVVVLGAGFSGCKAVYLARKHGLSVHVFESASGMGGTWRNNRYPGARVDSWTPIYQLDIPEVYKDWKFHEKYPGHSEICAYFDHVDDVLHIKKDMTFNTFVKEASFDEKKGIWTLKDSNGKTLSHSKYFLPCIGFASRKYTPDYEGFEKFKGKVIHSSDWPDGIDLKGKRIGLMGTGSTGVQITQELGPIAKELYLYQRTPNLTLPMRQEKDPKQENQKYGEILPKRPYNPTGFDVFPIYKNAPEVPRAEREAAYEKMWAMGGFTFWFCNYQDMLFSQESNDLAYDFWRRKTIQRIKNKDLWEDLAPKKQPHPFGTKRPSLEQNFYEQFERPNVHLKNISKNPIKRFFENGIELADGSRQEFDVMIFATGFDAVTGSFKNIDIRNIHTGKILRDEWESGCQTYMGISIYGYPNMYFSYGPQAPTAFTNGPSTCEKQLDWIFDVIDYTEKNHLKYLDAKKDEQVKYTNTIAEHTARSLYTKAKSWYMGANIPGKKVEMLNWIAGVDKYSLMLDASTKANYPGFVKVES